MEISVIMPAYNAEAFISEAIESILNQTYKNFEFIIVDDGSTDETLHIIGKYAKLDKRIHVVTQKNEGVSSALNKGIEKAKGEWIAVMHADDIALPHRFERQIAAAKSNPNVVVWGAYAYHISEKGKVLGISKVGPTNEEQFYNILQKGEVILVIHPTAFMRREAIMEVGGYNPMFDGSEELQLFDRLSELGPILAVPEPLILYRIHPSSISMQRFFNMRVFTRFIRARQRAKAQGKEPPTWEQFIKEYNNAFLPRRIHRYIDDLSQFYYRKAGVSVSGERYFHAVWYFLIACVLNPKYTIPRIWNQRFSHLAKEFLRRSYENQ